MKKERRKARLVPTSFLFILFFSRQCLHRIRIFFFFSLTFTIFRLLFVFRYIFYSLLLSVCRFARCLLFLISRSFSFIFACVRKLPLEIEREREHEYFFISLSTLSYGSFSLLFLHTRSVSFHSFNNISPSLSSLPRQTLFFSTQTTNLLFLSHLQFP